jgi:hypothetical protein
VKVETSQQYLKNDPAFAEDESRQALLGRLKALPGVNITTTKLNGWPATPLDQLGRTEVWKGF